VSMKNVVIGLIVSAIFLSSCGVSTHLLRKQVIASTTTKQTTTTTIFTGKNSPAMFKFIRENSPDRFGTKYAMWQSSQNDQWVQWEYLGKSGLFEFAWGLWTNNRWYFINATPHGRTAYAKSVCPYLASSTSECGPMDEYWPANNF